MSYLKYIHVVFIIQWRHEIAFINIIWVYRFVPKAKENPLTQMYFWETTKYNIVKTMIT